MLEGAWFSEGSPAFVFCRWWWERSETVLHVICGTKHGAWAPPPVRPDIETRLIDDFPEIARDVASHL